MLGALLKRPVPDSLVGVSYVDSMLLVSQSLRSYREWQKNQLCTKSLVLTRLSTHCTNALVLLRHRCSSVSRTQCPTQHCHRRCWPSFREFSCDFIYFLLLFENYSFIHAWLGWPSTHSGPHLTWTFAPPAAPPSPLLWSFIILSSRPSPTGQPFSSSLPSTPTDAQVKRHRWSQDLHRRGGMQFLPCCLWCCLLPIILHLAVLYSG